MIPTVVPQRPAPLSHRRQDDRRGTPRLVVGIVTEVFNAVNGEGYTEDYNDGRVQWMALAYTAEVNLNGSVLSAVPVGRSNIQQWRPPILVRSLAVGDVVLGVQLGHRIFWIYQELPSNGECEGQSQFSLSPSAVAAMRAT